MTVWRNMLRMALIMMAFTAFMAFIMAIIFVATKAPIANSVEKAKLALLHEILPRNSYDNDLLHTTIKLNLQDAKKLGNDQASEVYLAKKNNRTESVIVETTAPDGYGGKIHLLLGIRRDGVIQAVRVIAHKETPGLGDYIERAKSPWILQFNQQSIHIPQSAWRVKKEEGIFDYRAGATISAKAIVRAVHTAATMIMSEHQRFFGE